jgi:hypothetical protein
MTLVGDRPILPDFSWPVARLALALSGHDAAARVEFR